MTTPRPQAKQPIPKHAKKVFEGILFDIYQWEQELFDGSTATFEKVARKTDSVTIIPVLENGNILILEEAQPGTSVMINPPGGMMDPGEDPEAAAARELLEETGYTSNDLTLWLAHQPSLRLEWATYIFIARNCVKVQDAENDAGEKMQLKEMSFDAFLNTASSSDFYNVDIRVKALEAKSDPQKMEELKKLLGV